MDRLPPLNAIRAFEAAARHMSIRLAADELSVTPGAVWPPMRPRLGHAFAAASTNYVSRCRDRGSRLVSFAE